MFRLMVCVLFLFVMGALSSGRQYVELEPELAAASEQKWRVEGRAQGTVSLSFPLSFQSGGAARLKRELYNRADPKSDRFRKWLSKEQVDQILQAPKESVEIVRDWIRRETSVEPTLVAQRYLNVDLSVKLAERLLRTNFYAVSSVSRPELTFKRSMTAYHLPQHIAVHIDGFVGGVKHLPNVEFARVKPTAAANKNKRAVFVTPNLIKERYNVGSYESPQGTSNIGSVASFLGQHYHQSDLDIFFTFYAHDQSKSLRHPKVVGPNHGFAGVEASLDIQYFMGVSTNTPTQFWSTAGNANNGQERFLEFMQNIANTSDADVPKVISVSYGDEEASISLDYIKRTDAEFQAAGARGITILFASGDSGVSSDGSCGANGQFTPSFPNDSPHVTNVGGVLHASASHPEAWSGSGGGFSNVFPRPSYQNAAVEAFLQNSKELPDKSRFNATGRAYPDVSAYSTGFLVITNLIPSPVDGTSCAAPTFSAVVSLLNSVLISQGNSTLGFMQPWLYSLDGNGLQPVSVGCNPACGSNGFCATPDSKWSPVTGFGQPDFEALRKLL